MDKIIVYVDDAAYARRQLAPMETGTAARPLPTHWILVACPPRMTRHVSRWVTQTTRASWRDRWAKQLFGQLAPELQARGDRTSLLLAEEPLARMSARLRQEYGAARILDARRPKFGADLPPVTNDQPVSSGPSWAVPGAVAGLGAALVLASE